MSRALTYCSSFVVLGLVTGALGPALGYFAHHTGVPLERMGILFSATGAGNLVGNVWGARLYDRMPGHRVLAGALAALAVTLLAAPWVPTLGALVSVSFVAGIAKSTLDSGGNTLTLWGYPANAASYVSMLHFCFGAGAFLSPIVLAHTMAQTGNIAVGYAMLALCAGVVMLGCLMLPSPGAASPTTTAAPPTTTDWKLVSLVAVFLFLYVGTEVGFGGWIFVYASTHLSSGVTGAGYLTSAFWGALTLTRLISSPVAGRLRPQPALFTVLSICMAASCVLALRGTGPTLWIGAIGLGVGMAIVFPLMMTLVRDVIGVSGRTIGQLGLGASLGSISLPWLVGRLSRPIGPSIVLWFPLVTMGLAVAVLLALRANIGARSARGHG